MMGLHYGIFRKHQHYNSVKYLFCEEISLKELVHCP